MSAEPETVSQASMSKDPDWAAPPRPRDPATRRARRREWWHVNGWFLIAVVLVICFWPVLDALETVPAIPDTQHFQLVAKPFLVGNTPTGPDYQWFGYASAQYGGTMSGSYWAPSGVSLSIVVGYGSGTYRSSNSSGIFELSTGNSLATMQVIFESSSPAPIYLNATNAYLAPILHS